MGRPTGYRKPNALGARIALRLTPEQVAQLAQVPGKTTSAKVRHLINALACSHCEEFFATQDDLFSHKASRHDW